MKEAMIAVTFYCLLALKLRIDQAAALDERSASKYLVRLLTCVVPPSEPAAQLDIEEAIAKSEASENQIKRIRKVAAKAAAATTKPRNKK